VFPIEKFGEDYRFVVNAVIGGDNQVDNYKEMRRAREVVNNKFRQKIFDKYGGETDPTEAQVSNSAVTIKGRDGIVYEYRIVKLGDNRNEIVKTNLSTGAKQKLTGLVKRERHYWLKDQDLANLPEVVQIASNGRDVFLVFRDRYYIGTVNGLGIEITDQSDAYAMTLGWTVGMVFIPDKNTFSADQLYLYGINAFGETSWYNIDPSVGVEERIDRLLFHINQNFFTSRLASSLEVYIAYAKTIL